MAITIRLDGPLSSKEELWLVNNVGPRLHYIHNSVGGQGWLAKRHNIIVENIKGGIQNYETQWRLTFEEDKFATWFSLMFPQ